MSEKMLNANAPHRQAPKSPKNKSTQLSTASSAPAGEKKPSSSYTYPKPPKASKKPRTSLPKT